MHQKGFTNVFSVHLSLQTMFDHLFKICLSLILVTSLMVPMKWCCADNEQRESDFITAKQNCCVPKTNQNEQPPAPVNPITNNCACCDTNVFTNVTKAKIDSHKTPLYSSNSQLKTIQTETRHAVGNHGLSDQSRSLHLMHCVWIC